MLRSDHGIWGHGKVRADQGQIGHVSEVSMRWCASLGSSDPSRIRSGCAGHQWHLVGTGSYHWVKVGSYHNVDCDLVESVVKLC